MRVAVTDNQRADTMSQYFTKYMPVWWAYALALAPLLIGRPLAVAVERRALGRGQQSLGELQAVLIAWRRRLHTAQH